MILCEGRWAVPSDGLSTDIQAGGTKSGQEPKYRRNTRIWRWLMAPTTEVGDGQV